MVCGYVALCQGWCRRWQGQELVLGKMGRVQQLVSIIPMEWLWIRQVPCGAKYELCCREEDHDDAAIRYVVRIYMFVCMYVCMYVCMCV